MINKNYLFEYAHEGVVCLNCGKVLISYHRHDYKICACEQSTMIDGGQIDYVRKGGKDLKLIRDVMIIPIFRTKTGRISKRKIKSFREVYSEVKKK